MLTQQQIFDKAAKGVLKQGGPTRQVLQKNECSYYDTNTFAKCNIGHLLPDDVANVWQNELRIGSLETGLCTPRKSNLVRKDLGDAGIEVQNHIEFLNDLQSVHDDARNMDWYKKNMQQLAKDYGLCASSLNATT